MPPFRLAHAWPGSHRPHTPATERAFVAELSRSRGRRLRATSFDRNDVTWLLTALRAGAAAHTVTELAQGIEVARLHAAYCELETLRAESAAAWRSLCNTRRTDGLSRWGGAAAKLLPVPVARLHTAGSDPGEVVASVAAEVVRVHELCDAVAAMVERIAEVSEYDAQLEARRLWGPAGGCLWNDPYFLPRRVGELTPIRAVDLLGEARGEDLT